MDGAPPRPILTRAALVGWRDAQADADAQQEAGGKQSAAQAPRLSEAEAEVARLGGLAPGSPVLAIMRESGALAETVVRLAKVTRDLAAVLEPAELERAKADAVEGAVQARPAPCALHAPSAPFPRLHASALSLRPPCELGPVPGAFVHLALHLVLYPWMGVTRDGT